MKELNMEEMEIVSGAKMSFACGLSIAALGLGAVAVGSLTGGIGFFGAITLAELAISSVGFMTSCGPKDFK